MGFTLLYSRQREKEISEGIKYDSEGNELVQWHNIFDFYNGDEQDSFDKATNRGANSESLFRESKLLKDMVKEKQIGGMY